MSLKVDVPDKNAAEEKSKDWPQIVALGLASLGMMTFGTLFAWPSPSIPKLLTAEYGITIEQISYLTVVGPLSMALWSPVFSKLIDVIGRKKTILSCSTLHITAWLLIAFANRTYYLYVLSRFMSGTADACCMIAIPTYIAEVTKPKVRDKYGSLMVTIIFFGQFLVNCVGYYCSIQTTAFIFLCIPVFFAVTFTFMPESPYYCCMKEDIGEARRSMQKLYRKMDVEGELTQLSFDVKRQMSERGSFKDLWIIKSNRKAFIIANLARTVQQFSGITALVSYAQYIFQKCSSDISSGIAAMIFNSLLVVGSLFGTVVSNKLGKTLALVISGLVAGVALVIVTIYFYLEIYTDVEVSTANYVPVIGLILYVTGIALGLATIPTTLMGEIFSASIRSKAAMFTNMVFALYVGGFNKLLQYLITTFGMCIPFLVFAICCFLGAIISFFVIPNTNGKTLEEIQQILKGNKK